MTGPERQCIGCGRRGPADVFIRLSLDRAVAPPLVVGTSRERRGRGAYLCRRQACLDRALHRKSFHRAFRETVVVESGQIMALLAAEGGE